MGDDGDAVVERGMWESRERRQKERGSKGRSRQRDEDKKGGGGSEKKREVSKCKDE